jgi:phage tail sheath protein FI
VPPPGLDGLRLDPSIPGDLARIVSLQQRVVELAGTLQSFIALLDVPPGLRFRQLLEWRNQFDSAYAAAYHPWLVVSRRDDSRDGLVRVNPSAVAAGIIANREIALGIPHGPANVIASGVVNVSERVAGVQHDALHPQGINVYLLERDGVRLTGARTLARDPIWRQLSVRRLITMLRRTLDQQMQWAVFEPNTPALWSDIRHLLEAYLRRLYRANAFTGATEQEAFFVKCDDEVNPRQAIDQGRLLAYVGVAPAEPLEFIVLQIARDGDGTLRVEG